MPTIKDVAREAGVSIATVSYVLNNKLDAVSEETRQLVWEAVHRIGYTPNVTARNLRSSQSRLIGYAWHETPHEQVNPVLDQFMYSLAHFAENAGYHILTFTFAQNDPIPVYDELIRSGRVDAFVISGTVMHDKRIEYLMKGTTPFVSFGRSNPEWQFDWVDTDGTAGTRRAMDYLFTLGHRRIAFAGWDDASLAGKHRLQGYLDAMQAIHTPVHEGYVFHGTQSEQTGIDALTRFNSLPADIRPTAVMCVSDLVAIGVKNEAERLGMEIGRDISIIGFDDAPMLQYLRPPMTTLRQPLRDIARTLIEMLESKLGDTASARKRVPRTRLLAPELIVRESCGRPRA
jgi:DNA-binding LacI/PurR family transcriptional regulator